MSVFRKGRVAVSNLVVEGHSYVGRSCYWDTVWFLTGYNMLMGGGVSCHMSTLRNANVVLLIFHDSHVNFIFNK